MILELAANGANVRAKARNPFDGAVNDWSALHILAEEGHSNCNEILTFVIESGCEVDDVSERVSATPEPNKTTPTRVRQGETAFSCALRNNAFAICNDLLGFGADPNALSTTAGLFVVDQPTTILGHVILSNARYSYARLNFLLDLEDTMFIVQPKLNITALHRAVMGMYGVSIVGGVRKLPDELDSDVNKATMRQLLTKYNTKQYLDAKCHMYGATALHLACFYGNAQAAMLLTEAGADVSVPDDNDKYPGDVVDLKMKQWPLYTVQSMSKFDLPRALLRQ